MWKLLAPGIRLTDFLTPVLASHQVSVHLAKQLQRRRFLEIDQSETRMACGGHVY
jgi:hypothetical protein